MTCSKNSSIGIFEKYLYLWIGICIIFGVILGYIFPSIFKLIASLEYASVNLVVAIFMWVTIYPMMVIIDFTSIKDVRKKPRGLCITLVVN